MEVGCSMTLIEIEALVERTLQAAIAGGVVKKVAAEVWEKVKGSTQVDEVARLNLTELRQHCQAAIDLIDRVLSLV